MSQKTSKTEDPTSSGTKTVSVADQMKKAITLMEPQFKMALPAHIPVEKFMRVSQTAIQTTPALLKADRQTLFAACMKAAQAGLLPDGKEAALVTFGDKVQFMPMVAGLMKQARNSGEISTITAQLVYKNDEFAYWVDSDGEHLSHKPMLFGDRGEIIGVYALAKTRDNAVYIEVMTAQQVEAVRSVSRSKDSGPWAGPFKHEMWKKSAIRRLCKRLPMSTDLDHALQADDELYDLNQDKAQDQEPVPAKVSRLHQHLSQVETDVTHTDPEPPSQDDKEDIPI